jgi:hypothetical protein
VVDSRKFLSCRFLPRLLREIHFEGIKFALGKRPVQSEFLRMPVLLHRPPFGVFEPNAKSKLAAERVHDQSATAKLVEKNKAAGPAFAYFAEISTFATLGPNPCFL